MLSDEVLSGACEKPDFAIKRWPRRICVTSSRNFFMYFHVDITFVEPSARLLPPQDLGRVSWVFLWDESYATRR